MNEIVKDPVCHMDVPASSFPIVYAGIHFAFCSAQCQERFQANPHLYTGYPGKKSPAQSGKEILKRRRMVLAEPLNAQQGELVKRKLLEMMGIKSVCIEGDKIEIEYDLMQATVEQIAEQLALIDTELGGDWINRLKLGFINYLEDCEIGSLEVTNKNRCH